MNMRSETTNLISMQSQFKQDVTDLHCWYWTEKSKDNIYTLNLGFRASKDKANYAFQDATATPDRDYDESKHTIGFMLNNQPNDDQTVKLTVPEGGYFSLHFSGKKALQGKWFGSFPEYKVNMPCLKEPCDGKKDDVYSMYKRNKIYEGFKESTKTKWSVSKALTSNKDYDAHMSGSVSRKIDEKWITDTDWSNTMEITFWYTEGERNENDMALVGSKSVRQMMILREPTIDDPAMVMAGASNILTASVFFTAYLFF